MKRAVLLAAYASNQLFLPAFVLSCFVCTSLICRQRHFDPAMHIIAAASDPAELQSHTDLNLAYMMMPGSEAQQADSSGS